MKSRFFNTPFWHFLTLQLFREWRKHLTIVIISTLLLFLLSSVLFIASSIRFSLEKGVTPQPDFVVSRLQGGRAISTPMVWSDEFVDIYGVTKVTPRIYGRYFFKPKEKSFLIVGIDFFEEQSHQNLERLMEGMDVKTFLKTEAMVVGDGVKKYLETNFYKDNYKFLTPKGEFLPIKIFQTLPKETQLVANDMIIMPIDLARKVLGYNEDEVTDITFNVPNPDEWNTIEEKILSLHYNLRVITKNEIKKSYANLYNYKGGFFLILFLILLITFSLILYQRYSMVYSDEKRHIGLLRALGWSINDVLKLKFIETIIIIISSYIIALSMAYLFVFIMDAPLLKNIFLGSQNLNNNLTFIPIIPIHTLSSIFLLYATPFITAVIVPVWRVSTSNPKEAML